MTTRRPFASRLSRTRRRHASPHPALDRMRFLFTMSEIERPRFSADLPSTLSKRQAPRKRNLFRLHRKDWAAPRPGQAPSKPQAKSLAKETDLGGARRDRTDDLMLAKHALSQLSYGPVSRPAGAERPVVVGLGGLEPPTSRLSSARSNQLSYKPGRKEKSDARPGFSKPIETQVFHILKSERETKAARSRKMRPDWAA
jgi:hypothetical protein